MCPFVRYFLTFFGDDITKNCWWKLSKQASYWSKTGFFLTYKSKQYFHLKLALYHPKITYKNNVQKEMNKFFDKEMYLNLLMWWGGRHKHVKFGQCRPMSSRSWPAKNCEGTRASAKKKGLYRWCLKLLHSSSKELHIVTWFTLYIISS